jgi:hypothetical protein
VLSGDFELPLTRRLTLRYAVGYADNLDLIKSQFNGDSFES